MVEVQVERKPSVIDNFFTIAKFEPTIICGDVVKEMKNLVEKGEKFDCIYADPDYNVGIRYGDEGCKTEFKKYIDWCIEWSRLAHELLGNKGNFFIINYPENTAYLRVNYLDEAFYDVQEYVWIYNVNIGQHQKRFTRAHRTIMHCTKAKDNNFYKDNVAMPYQNPEDKRIQQNIKNGSKGRMPYSWLYYDLVKNVSKDKTFHPCQIPRPLSKLLIGACTKPTDKVLILFTGSGNDVLSAWELGTKITTIDKNKSYCTLMKERIAKLMSLSLSHYTERS
jgi:site-specific DNA-methyltransferase (adenine-specific)